MIRLKEILTKKGILLSLVVIVIISLILNIPYLTNNYMLRVINMTMITYICVLSLYVLFGMCGQHSFAQAGLWGVGAYITGNVSKLLQLPAIVCILISMVGTALLAFVLGLVLFRLRKYYFTFSTIGVMMILFGLFQNWTPVTGGAMGMSDIPRFSFFGHSLQAEGSYFYLIFIMALLASVAVMLLFRSALGRSFMAIRDNEIAADSLGINSLLTKDIAFAISGALCGLAGALFASLAGYISSATFTYSQSTMYLVMIMLGGSSTPFGALVGAVILSLMPEWARALKSYMMLIYGVGIMVLMIVLPEGIVGGGKDLYAKYVEKRKKSRAVAKECQ